MSSIVLLVKNDLCLEGFKTPVNQIIFGNFNLYDRIERQLTSQGCQFNVVNTLPPNFQGIVFHSDTLYSEKAISYMLQNLNLETTLNHAIVFDETQPSFHSESNDLPKIKQNEIYAVKINLPEQVYFKKISRVPFPDFFIQSVKAWPDLITVASLIAREKTIRAADRFKIIGKPNLKSIFDNQMLAGKFNKIGKSCKIHKTAVLESCQIGDNVEIGPYSYIKSSVIGSGTVVHERSSIKLSVVGPGSFIMPCDIFNSFIGTTCSIFTSMIHNSFIGDSTFIGGASGFSDFNAGKTAIKIYANNKSVSSGKQFLGACVAENCFIGSGLIFQSGLMIPHDTSVINGSMIFKSDFTADKKYVATGGRVTQIPKDFF